MIGKNNSSHFCLGNLLSSNAAACTAVLVVIVYAVVLSVLHWVPVNDALVFVLVLCGIFELLELCTPRARAIALFVITEILVLSWILHLWTVGFGGRNMIFGGILPWSDAGGYYAGAMRVVHGFPMLWASKRPIFPEALAVLLKLFDGNLRAALLIFALFAGFAIALVASELWGTHGRRVALYVYAVLLLSERVWAGFVQTEHIGLPFGVIGFILIWRAVAAAEKDYPTARWLALAGIFSITIALMARVGAFFVLPALAFWSARNLFAAGTAWTARSRFLSLTVLAMGAGVFVHATIYYLSTAGATFSDYPLILYGLIHHRDWDYIFEVYPQLRSMPLGDSASTHAAWMIVLQDASAHPLGVLGGFARSFAEFFVSREGLFGFIWRNYDDIILENGAVIRASIAEHGLAGPLLLWLRTFGMYSVANAVTMFVLAVAFVIATTVGIIELYRRPVDSYGLLIRYAIAGILFSALFTPPWITPAHRIAVATLPFLATAPALVLFGARPNRVPRQFGRRLGYVPISLALALLSGVIFLRLVPPPIPVCTGVNRHIVELYPGTTVDVVSSESFNFRKKAIGVLDYSIRFLKRHELRFAESLVPFLRPGTRYISAFDACDGNTKVLIDDSNLLEPARPGWQSIEAKPLAEENVMHVLRPAHAVGVSSHRMPMRK
jgi:hypothetical protein